jgi:hypothetical protein
MPDPSSAPDPEVPGIAAWPVKTRLLMLALNSLPMWHVLLTIVTALVMASEFGMWPGVGVALILLYLLPPLATRLLLFFFPIRHGTHRIDSREFLIWWATSQWQMIFCRLPALEECLRLVPGLYSLWLRLWGAKIGRLTFWSAGLRILDRSLLRIGDDVVFGSGVRLNPHVIVEEDGQKFLHLAPITIGDRALIGGYSLLTAGVTIGPDAALRSFSMLPPFNEWSQGRRQKPTATHTTT